MTDSRKFRGTSLGMPRHRYSGSSGDNDAVGLRRGIAYQNGLQVSASAARSLGGRLQPIINTSSIGISDKPKGSLLSEGIDK